MKSCPPNSTLQLVLLSFVEWHHDNGFIFEATSNVMTTENTVRHFYRVRAQGLSDLSSLFGILGSYLREGCKSARSSLMSDDTATQGPFGVPVSLELAFVLLNLSFRRV